MELCLAAVSPGELWSFLWSAPPCPIGWTPNVSERPPFLRPALCRSPVLSFVSSLVHSDVSNEEIGSRLASFYPLMGPGCSCSQTTSVTSAVKTTIDRFQQINLVA
ncbi:hypothetical protein D4764_05G0003830 [Takifugu flavidus]|uniref:Uncharacterized protein n=1 Tax=Takifugu flavidus TaxID=433684 RepID=A0A5C6MZ67_9TELE|nr:hypothetical protein D4764_05G0003830 [Takifugu flavidus]